MNNITKIMLIVLAIICITAVFVAFNFGAVMEFSRTLLDKFFMM